MPAAGGPDEGDRPTLADRLRRALLKPEDPARPSRPPSPARAASVEELEAAVRYADDKERLIGLLAAPVSAAIGVIVTSALISNDPTGSRHVAVGVYHELEIVLLVLALAMLTLALRRRRLLLGVVMALYGLTLFNMHYLGFGVPFLIAGSWYLVRAYRAQRELREATGDGRVGPAGPGTGRGPTWRSARPRPSSRYTPPTPPRRGSPPRRSSTDRDKRAG